MKVRSLICILIFFLTPIFNVVANDKSKAPDSTSLGPHPVASGENGNKDDVGLIATRGKLALQHLSLLYKWETEGNAPASIGVGTQGLKGKIDFSQVGLFGHSRGGQGVRAAYNLYKDQTGLDRHL